MQSGAFLPTSSLEVVAQELRTIGVIVLLHALAVLASPSGKAILWNAVDVTQIGDLMDLPRISVSVPFHLD